MLNRSLLLLALLLFPSTVVGLSVAPPTRTSTSTTRQTLSSPLFQPNTNSRRSHVAPLHQSSIAVNGGTATVPMSKLSSTLTRVSQEKMMFLAVLLSNSTFKFNLIFLTFLTTRSHFLLLIYYLHVPSPSSSCSDWRNVLHSQHVRRSSPDTPSATARYQDGLAFQTLL